MAILQPEIARGVKDDDTDDECKSGEGGTHFHLVLATRRKPRASANHDGQCKPLRIVPAPSPLKKFAFTSCSTGQVKSLWSTI